MTRARRSARSGCSTTAGVAIAVGAELVVFHPGFLLGRTREAALEAVVEQLAELRERLEAKDPVVPFGIEIMGRAGRPKAASSVAPVASGYEHDTASFP